MNNIPFNCLFQEFQRLHPETKLCEKIKATPISQLICLSIYFISIVVYIVSLAVHLLWLTILSLTVLAASGTVLIIYIRKHKKPFDIGTYTTKSISPLRSFLKKNNLYTLNAVDLLIEKCETESKKETNLEKYMRHSNVILSFVIKYVGIISAFTLLLQMGVIDMNTLEPTLESVFSCVISLFVLNYELGLLVSITMFCALLACTLVQYCCRSILDELNNRRREKIFALIGDLKFIRLDFPSDNTD